LIVTVSNRDNNGIQLRWQLLKNRFLVFMDWIAKARRTTPSCRG